MTSATSMPHFSCASCVLAPRCGVSVMAGCLRNGCSAGQRLGGKHIQRGGGDLARIQRRQQVVLDDDLPPRAIHDADLGLHLREGRRVEHAARLVGHRHVDGDEVRVPIDLVQVAERARCPAPWRGPPSGTGHSPAPSCRRPAPVWPPRCRCGPGPARPASCPTVPSPWNCLRSHLPAAIEA